MENELLRGNFEINLLKDEYLRYIDVKEKTIETYNTGIKRFIIYLNEHNIEKPTREDVIAFKNELKENNSIATVNIYLIALRNFFKFLEYKGLYKNITENVKGLKDSTLHKREALSLETCVKLLNDTKDTRERMLFTLFITCGLRVNEMVNIRLNDIKYENEQYRLYVYGKARDGKTDFVILPNEIVEQIKSYVKEYGITDYLFVSTSKHNLGGKMHPYSVRRIMNDLFKRAGIKNENVVVHSLRHSFATIAIENGSDIREVSKALRHQSLVTTERYLHDLEAKDNKCTNLLANKLFDLAEHRNN